MKINFTELLSGWGVKAMAGLAGWQAWLVNKILNRIWKVVWPAIQSAWGKAMDKLEDDKALNKYADEMAKGKDASEEQKLEDQLDLLNPKRK